MELIKLLVTQPAIFLLFGVLVWLLTYLIKSPIKKATALIIDEKNRKIANKWILLIPFILGIFFSVLYAYYKEKVWFYNVEEIFSNGFLIAVIAITWYNVFEGLKGRKSEYESTNEGNALFQMLLMYMKDKTKVKLLLDQCKTNLDTGTFTISDTVKGFLPAKTPDDVFKTFVKMIETFFEKELE